MQIIEKEIELVTLELAGAELAFRKSYDNYLQYAEQFRRASAERDRLVAELITLRQKRARVEAENESLDYCASL